VTDEKTLDDGLMRSDSLNLTIVNHAPIRKFMVEDGLHLHLTKLAPLSRSEALLIQVACYLLECPCGELVAEFEYPSDGMGLRRVDVQNLLSFCGVLTERRATARISALFSFLSSPRLSLSAISMRWYWSRSSSMPFTRKSLGS
jgi:hypothetical protein